MKRFFALAVLSLACAAPAVMAQGFVPVRDWDVYVDLPTGFAYVKTPERWVFVRQLDAGQLSRLPASTLTALLPPQAPEIRWAHPALEESPRVLALRTAPTQMAGTAVRASAQQ